MPECCQFSHPNLLVLPRRCRLPRWGVVFRAATGKLTHHWALCMRFAETLTPRGLASPCPSDRDSTRAARIACVRVRCCVRQRIHPLAHAPSSGMFSFDTPYSVTGLYVNMSSFQVCPRGYGRPSRVEWRGGRFRGQPPLPRATTGRRDSHASRGPHLREDCRVVADPNPAAPPLPRLVCTAQGARPTVPAAEGLPKGCPGQTNRIPGSLWGTLAVQGARAARGASLRHFLYPRAACCWVAVLTEATDNLLPFISQLVYRVWQTAHVMSNTAQGCRYLSPGPRRSIEASPCFAHVHSCGGGFLD